MSADNINFEEWAAAMAQFQRGTIDIVPPGWINEWEYGEHFGLSQERSRTLLLRLWKAGMAERKKFAIWVGAKLDIRRPVWHYHLVKSTSANGKKAASPPKKAKAKSKKPKHSNAWEAWNGTD